MPKVSQKYLDWLDKHPEQHEKEFQNPDVVAAYQARKSGKLQANVEAETVKPKEETGFWNSIGLGGAQGATFGFGDEIQGGIQALGNKLMAGKGETPAGYVEERDRARAENDAAQKAHPYAYGAAEIAGALPATIATGGGATATGRTLLAAGQGTASALGNSKADLTKGEFGDAYKDMTIGGAVSGLLSGAGEVVSTGIKGVRDSIARKANLKYFNAAHPGIRDYKLVGGVDEAAKIGRRLKDEGVVNFGSNAGNIADNIAPKLEETAKGLDDVYAGLEGEAVKQGKRINIDELQGQLKEDMLPNWQESAYAPAKNTANNEIDKLGGNFIDDMSADEGATISFQNLRKEKAALGKVAGFDKLGDPLSGMAKQDLYGSIARNVEGRAKDLSPELATKLKSLNQRYSQLSDANKIAIDAAMKEVKDGGIDLRDMVLTLAGGPAGAGAAALKHLLKGRGASISAKSLDALAALTSPAASAVKGTANVTRAVSDTNDPNKAKKRKKRDYIDEY